MTTPEAALKPDNCPFCGSKEVQYRYTGSSCHEFFCPTATCPDVQVFYRDIERAYEAYNTRTPAPTDEARARLYDLTDKMIDEVFKEPDDEFLHYRVDRGNIQALVGRIFDALLAVAPTKSVRVEE